LTPRAPSSVSGGEILAQPGVGNCRDCLVPMGAQESVPSRAPRGSPSRHHAVVDQRSGVGPACASGILEDYVYPIILPVRQVNEPVRRPSAQRGRRAVRRTPGRCSGPQTTSARATPQARSEVIRASNLTSCKGEHHYSVDDSGALKSRLLLCSLTCVFELVESPRPT